MKLQGSSFSSGYLFNFSSSLLFSRSASSWHHRPASALKAGCYLTFSTIALSTLALVSAGTANATNEISGTGPNFQADSRLSQEQIANREVSLEEIRNAGMLVFSTPFNKADGFGSGTEEGLQENGTFLRLNGLDAQTCLECHGVVSTRTIPATFGVGGGGGINNSVMFMPQTIEMFEGGATFDGRVINPPALFGAGGVELLAREMTQDLQDLLASAQLAPEGSVTPLVSKGVSFGELITAAGGIVDVSGVQGVDEDLVVKPFGRKGGAPSLRAFDIDAMAFHHGMQSVEALADGRQTDDSDGISNEITEGDLSALSIFQATLEPPFQLHDRRLNRGSRLFQQGGCADCHRPMMETSQRHLPFKLSGAADEPFADTFYEVDLSAAPTRFRRNRRGGIQVKLFSDLKRHDMGTSMAENFHGASEQQNREYITARLWGLADSGPYMHDGRALSISDAIGMHGGEAEDAADWFENLSAAERQQLLDFLMSLRAPEEPAKDLFDKFSK